MARVSLDKLAGLGCLALATVLVGCGSAQVSAAHQVAVQTRTVTAPPSTVIVHTVAPSTIASSTKAKVPAAKPKLAVAAKPKAAAPKPTTAAGLCGAPANPFGYTFCGGQVITAPDPAVCDYFDCIPYFPKGVGYMEQCRDGRYSMSGGRRGACSSHGGENQPVLKP